MLESGCRVAGTGTGDGTAHGMYCTAGHALLRRTQACPLSALGEPHLLPVTFSAPPSSLPLTPDRSASWSSSWRSGTPS